MGACAGKEAAVEVRAVEAPAAERAVGSGGSWGAVAAMPTTSSTPSPRRSPNEAASPNAKMSPVRDACQ
jgi:hypothetical protein